MLQLKALCVIHKHSTNRAITQFKKKIIKGLPALPTDRRNYWRNCVLWLWLTRYGNLAAAWTEAFIFLFSGLEKPLEVLWGKSVHWVMQLPLCLLWEVWNWNCSWGVWLRQDWYFCFNLKVVAWGDQALLSMSQRHCGISIGIVLAFFPHP